MAKYTTHMPPGWRLGKSKPKPRRGYKTGMPGPGSPFAGMYVTKPVRVVGGLGGPDRPPGRGRRPKPPKITAPKPAPGPYDEFADVPGAKGAFEELDRLQAAHQAYGTGVQNNLAQGLAALTGVNPASPGYNPVIQQQYLANVAGSVGNAL